MTFTAVTGPGRVVQMLWGARTQNTLTFAYPASVDAAKFWREPRAGGEQIVMNNLAESWIATRDFMGEFTMRWLQLQFWTGHAGVQAFLDWAGGGGAFTLVPDAANAPLFGAAGCLLVTPFMPQTPGLETDGSQKYAITIRNPTTDLGLAWR
jgi:hypothetical protein